MNKQEVEVFIHTSGAKPAAIAAASDETLRDVLIRAGVLGDGEGDLHIFVGEDEELHDDYDEADEADDAAKNEDGRKPTDISQTIEVLELKRRRHVHCHRCRRIGVDVNFGGRTIERKFSPATTVGRVATWARRKLRLDAAAAAEYVLQLCGSVDQPRSDVHLGELAVTPTCSLCFDLVKEVTPQGCAYVRA